MGDWNVKVAQCDRCNIRFMSVYSDRLWDEQQGLLCPKCEQREAYPVFDVPARMEIAGHIRSIDPSELPINQMFAGDFTPKDEQTIDKYEEVKDALKMHSIGQWFEEQMGDNNA